LRVFRYATMKMATWRMGMGNRHHGITEPHQEP
jgi:hypothetical protein